MSSRRKNGGEMSADFVFSLDQSQPPPDMSKAMQALWWAKKGDFAVGLEWERAHLLCQQGEGKPELDLVHALLHWMEGDMGNADFWYHRAGQKRTKPSVAEEWEHLAKRFGRGET